jgi:hypothetical protein
MNERESNPERQKAKLTDKCNDCGKKYELTDSNTIAYLYSEYAAANHLDCTCPNCSKLWTIFIGQETTEKLRSTDIYIQSKTLPDDDVLKKYIGLREIPLIEQYEITPRQEAIVSKFGEAILNMPPEIFWDNIEAVTEKPYPSRWT